MQNKIDKSTNKPRRLSLLIVYGVLEKGGYANILLDKYLQAADLEAEDRHLVTEIANGTIRMLKHLDWVLNIFLRKPIAAQNPWLRNILRISLYQMLFMDRIPDYAVVNSAVELVREKTGHRLGAVANGVLRNIARNRAEITYPAPEDKAQYLSVYYSQPEWLINQWLAEYDYPVLQDMLIYFNRRPLIYLRNNQLMGNREELLESLAREGVAGRASSRTPWGVIVEQLPGGFQQLTTYRQGRFYVQNEASMLAAAILNPQPGEDIIDLCCGVGGKTTFLAELTNNSGHIYAYDVYAHKIDLLRTNCDRLSISNITADVRDILALPEGHPPGAGVLLDAPCSGLGVLNRRADLRWKRTPADINGLIKLQTQLLDKAGRLTAPGGRLVYSTCTINRNENQAIVSEFLRRNPTFVLEDFTGDMGGFPLDAQDKKDAQAGMLTLLPGKYQTDGMFYAKMRRMAGE